MKTPEFAEAYARPRPFVRIESAYRQGVPFDKRMGDMTLLLLELEGPDRQLQPHQEKLCTRLHQEFSDRASETPVARHLLGEQKNELFSPDLTEDAAESVRKKYFDLQYEAFVAGWEEMVFGGDYTPDARRENLRRGQFFLAQQAIELAAVRHPMTLKTTDYPFFSPEMYWARRTMNGILNEYDTAIALMSLSISDENLIVVNAPSRFEEMNHHTAVDFLVYHRGSNQIMGIQAKSHYSREQAEEYDPDRVMMIHGVRDLKGEIGTRTRTRSTDPIQVVWPGILSAEVLSSLRPYGPNADIKGDFDRHTALYYKQLAARCQTHPMHPRTKVKGSVADARAAIADRLYERLGATRPKRDKSVSNGRGRSSRQKAKRRR